MLWPTEFVQVKCVVVTASDEFGDRSLVVLHSLALGPAGCPMYVNSDRGYGSLHLIYSVVSKCYASWCNLYKLF